MRNKKKKNKNQEYTKKVGGLGFIFSAMMTFVIGICFFIHSILILLIIGSLKKEIELFFVIFICILIIMSKLPTGRFRVFIHELKHAIFIVFTGNKINDFVVKKNSGNVSYKITKDDIVYLPLIALAPYYFPLLSLPVLILCLWFDNTYSLELSLLLGATLAFDLNTGIHDIHHEQDDFKKILGGFLVAGTYIGGSIFCWVNTCLLWVIGNNNGFIFCFENTLNALKRYFGD
ncbi:MAG: M50 family metallopeptidase [Deltaproteobacteria bacterium]|jgi:hypothetical protein|nr:M50 family metallopeptidase [Deltaproteobacteria bacterium]